MLRIVHALLATFSHRAWLYVDDLLALLCNHSVPQQVTIITFFLACVNAPISWRKAQLGNIVTWCGWTLRTDLESSHLAIGKLRKLQEQLEKLACSKKIPRKHLERAHVGHQHVHAPATLYGPALQGHVQRERRAAPDSCQGLASLSGRTQPRRSRATPAFGHVAPHRLAAHRSGVSKDPKQGRRPQGCFLCKAAMGSHG